MKKLPVSQSLQNIIEHDAERFLHDQIEMIHSISTGKLLYRVMLDWVIFRVDSITSKYIPEGITAQTIVISDITQRVQISYYFAGL